jgi:hypothetical protein
MKRMPIFVPPVIAWAVGAVAAAVLAKLAAKEWRRVNDELHPRQATANDIPREKLQTLRRDPRSGVYRPE